MSKHTPEPWVATKQPNGSVWIHERGLMPHATVYGRADLSSGKIESDSARIVACVNACAGINPEAVPGLLSMLKEVHGRLNDALNTLDRLGHKPDDFKDSWSVSHRACELLSRLT